MVGYVEEFTLAFPLNLTFSLREKAYGDRIVIIGNRHFPSETEWKRGISSATSD